MKMIAINLDLPPSERWNFVSDYSHELDELIDCYWVDIEDYVGFINEILETYKSMFVSEDYLAEIACLAKFSKYSADEILIANLYYDIVKFAFACTAFAINAPEGILHARNLDWWTENDILAKHTKVFNFTRNGKTVFKSVGWIGFIGVLSGMKPKRFAITLNAIVSEETANLGKPVTFLLREVLEEVSDFESAQTLLAKTPIICDCLLLLSGAKRAEFIVIERTPTKYKIRTADSGYIVVANDYKSFSNTGLDTGSELNTSSCGRYDQASLCLEKTPPKDADACFKILNNPKVKMQITVQQMVFNTGLDLLEVHY